MVDGEGDSNEGCLKWGLGVIKGSFQTHLYKGWVKAKLVCWEILIIHLAARPNLLICLNR